MPDAPDDPDRTEVVVRTSGEKGAPAPGAGTLGMWIFLASLTVLFASSLVAYLVIRLRADTWRPEGASSLPLGIWAATVFLVLCSLTMQKSLNDIRRGDQRKLRVGLVLTLVSIAGYLAAQTANWIAFYRTGSLYGSNLFGFTFYMLTGLHALHVIGGFVAVSVVTVRAFLGHYTWAYYPGVRNCALYWHYLGVVWIILFGVLALGG